MPILLFFPQNVPNQDFSVILACRWFGNSFLKTVAINFSYQNIVGAASTTTRAEKLWVGNPSYDQNMQLFFFQLVGTVHLDATSYEEGDR